MAARDRKPIYVICVDDEEEALEFMRGTALQLGLEPVSFRNVDSAIEGMRKLQADVALMIVDFRIGPEKTGIELRRATKDLWNIPFVIFSGYVTREMALEGLECKIDGFFEKPADQKILVEQLKRIAKNRISDIEERRMIEATFFAEARDIIDDLEIQILELEHTEDRRRSLDHIFRLVHTLKGSSASALSTVSIKNFAHSYEDMLGKLKSEPQTLQTQHIDILIRGKDLLHLMLDPAERNEEFPGYETFSFAIEGQAKVNEPSDHAVAGIAKSKDRAGSKSVRVSAEALDEIEYLTAETTIQRNMISKLLSTIQKEIPLNASVNILAEHFNEMSKLQSSIQTKVGMVHTVSFSEVTRPLSRIVRDLEKQLNKQAQIVFSGETLRVDHTTEKALAECLVHIVRNAMDHGLEDPISRRKAGKNDRGVIRVDAREDIERYYIQISDDGRGIDRDRVKDKALKMGLIQAADLQTMSDENVLQLIFSPGFSTAAQITDVSGRGVGADMVKTTIEALGGRIQLQSKPGEGTDLTLLVPKRNLSVSMMSVLVRVGADTFAVPQSSIFRLINLDASRNCQVLKSEGSFTLKIDEACVPLLSLQALVGKPSGGGYSSIGNGRDVMICGTAKGKIALAIDAILDSEEVVVRPLKDFVNAQHYFKGAALFDDGRVGLVLDPETLGQIVYAMRPEAEPRRNENLAGQQTTPQGTLNSFLLLESLDGQNCAVAESEVYRIEEIALSQLRISLHRHVLVYRDIITPVESLCFGSSPIDPGVGNPEDKGLFIVTQDQGGKFKAHRVKQVIDICEVMTQDILPNPLEGQNLHGFLRWETQLFQIIGLAPPPVDVIKPEAALATVIKLDVPSSPPAEAVGGGSAWGLFE